MFQDLVRKEDSIDNLKFLSFRLDFNEFYSSKQDNKFQELSFQTKFAEFEKAPAAKSPIINQNRGISPILGKVGRREGEDGRREGDGEERRREEEKRRKEEEERRREEEERRREEEEGRREEKGKKGGRGEEGKTGGEKKKRVFEFEKPKPTFSMEKTKAKFEMDRLPSFELEKNKQLAYKQASDFGLGKIEKNKPIFEIEGDKPFQIEKNKPTSEMDYSKPFFEIEKIKSASEIEKFKPNFELERGKPISELAKRSKPNIEIEKTKPVNEEKGLDYEEFGKGVEIKGGFEGIFQHYMEEEEEFLSDNHDSDTE